MKPHFSPLESKFGSLLWLPLEEGGTLELDEFIAAWTQSGIYRIAIQAEKQQPINTSKASRSY